MTFVITKDSETPDDIGVPALNPETRADLTAAYHLAFCVQRKMILGWLSIIGGGSRLSRLSFYLLLNGVTRLGLNIKGLKSLRVAIPSIPEQQQIAAFLDWKTGQIDALIARKKELLEKLKEKRIAVITQAVTRGLNPAAPIATPVSLGSAKSRSIGK